MLDVINSKIMNFFTKKEDKVYKGTANPNATNSELDAKRIIKKTPFIELIQSRGYKYDDGNDWYERTWQTNKGSETIKEVYQQLENGSWKQLMIGYGDRIFYEESVDGGS